MSPLEEHIADLLARSGESGFVYECQRCGQVLMSQRALRECPGCGGGALNLEFRVEEGRVVYWRDPDRSWPVDDVTGRLQDEPAIKLAVLWGSRARGDYRPLSDINLVVDWDDTEAAQRWGKNPEAELAARLRPSLDIPVEVQSLSRLRQEPLDLAAVLEEGVVLLDRRDHWAALKAEESEIQHAEGEL